MSNQIVPPEDCRTMAEVRAGVDGTDAALVALLAHRFAYMRAAARIKARREEVRDEARKAKVVEAVRRMARDAGLPDQEIARLWDRLVEASIAYEQAEWDRLRE